MSYKNNKNNILRNLKQFNRFNLNKRHNNSLKNNNYNKYSMDQILEKTDTMKSKSCFNRKKINNISTHKLFNKTLTLFNNKKKDVKIKFRNEKKVILKGSQTSFNYQSKKTSGIKNLKGIINNKIDSNAIKTNYSRLFNKSKSINLNNKNLFLLDNDRTNNYFNCNELLKDIDEEKNIADGKSFFYDKKLIKIYSDLMKNRNDINLEMKKYKESDFSLSFFDIKEKLFPYSFWEKVNSIFKKKK